MNEATIQDVGGFMSTASLLVANNGDVNCLRTNALLRDDEWKSIDDAVIRVARARMTAVDDLRAAGLTREVGGLGVIISEYEKIGDMEPAQQSLSGISEGEEDIPAFTIAGVPIPITHKDFRVNIRHLLATRRNGVGVDVTAAEISARLVIEKLEDMVFNGSAIRIGANVIQGLTTFTGRNTGSLVAGGWAAGGTTGEQILTDAIAMISALEGDFFYGPFTMYVPLNYLPKLRGDFKAASDKSILQRLMEIENLNAIRGTSKLTGNNVVLLQMTSDVIDLPVGQDLTTVQWEQKGGMEEHFKVMAAMSVRIKSDANGRSGIAHFSI